MQVRCDIDAKLEEEDEEEAVLPGMSSLLPSDSVGMKARVLMAKGRKLSTIYSKVSAISGNSQTSEGQVRPWAVPSRRCISFPLPECTIPSRATPCVPSSMYSIDQTVLTDLQL